MLKEPWAVLHLPRFALFLIFALVVEILSSRKKINPLCSWSTITLLLLTTLGGLFEFYFLLTTPWAWLGPFTIPVLYCPVVVAILLISLLSCIAGIRLLWKERLYFNCIARGVIFTAAFYFAITTAVAPVKVNATLKEREPGWIQDSHDQARAFLEECRYYGIVPPIEKWGVEEVHKYQSTIPELIELRKQIERFYSEFSELIMSIEGYEEAIDLYESLPEDMDEEERRKISNFDEYMKLILEDETISEAADDRFEAQRELRFRTFEYMIQDYENQDKMIKTDWMRIDLYLSYE